MIFNVDPPPPPPSGSNPPVRKIRLLQGFLLTTLRGSREAHSLALLIAPFSRVLWPRFFVKSILRTSPVFASLGGVGAHRRLRLQCLNFSFPPYPEVIFPLVPPPDTLFRWSVLFNYDAFDVSLILSSVRREALYDLPVLVPFLSFCLTVSLLRIWNRLPSESFRRRCGLVFRVQFSSSVLISARLDSFLFLLIRHRCYQSLDLRALP